MPGLDRKHTSYWTAMLANSGLVLTLDFERISDVRQPVITSAETKPRLF